MLLVCVCSAALESKVSNLEDRLGAEAQERMLASKNNRKTCNPHSHENTLLCPVRTQLWTRSRLFHQNQIRIFNITLIVYKIVTFLA